MINNELPLPHWRDLLVRHGRVQVTDYLQPEAAQALRECLERDVPWTLAAHDGPTPRTITPEERATLGPEGERAVIERCYARAREGYSFAYESYMMVRAYKEKRDPGLLLHRVLEFLNSPDYLEFARALTHDPRIRRMNAQATCYRPGHFLKSHNDVEPEEGRLYAYVINLTRDWDVDWGGQLQFFDDTGAVTATLMPRYNSLSIFKIPAAHAVTLVAPWALGSRYAITGWMLS